MRIGFGYDVHQLVAGRDLIVGGIKIPAEKGCLGHSDGDVLIHAICDALLGALNLGDLGQHFPDSSVEFKGIDSTILLDRVVEIIQWRGYALVNLDSVVSLQSPMLADHLPAMKECLARHLHTDPLNISIKATTTEKLGFIGRREGIAAYAMVLLENK